MIGGALQDGVGFDEPPQRPPEIGARRRQDREVIEARGPSHTRRRLALRQDQEIRAAGAQPGDALLAPMDDETQMRLVEPDRPIEVRDRQLDRANVRGWIHSP